MKVYRSIEAPLVSVSHSSCFPKPTEASIDHLAEIETKGRGTFTAYVVGIETKRPRKDLSSVRRLFYYTKVCDGQGVPSTFQTVSLTSITHYRRLS